MRARRSGRREAIALATAGIGLILAGASIWLLLTRWEGTGASGSAAGSVVPALVDFAAPDLALRDLNGNAGRLSDFLGQVVLVNLWATWCPPCRGEMALFQSLYTRHRGAGFSLVAINDGEPAAAVRRFVDERNITFPVWLDPDYRASDDAFHTASLPASYVIDRKGTVRVVCLGGIDLATLEAYVQPILEE